MERADGAPDSSHESLRLLWTQEYPRLVGALSLYTGDIQLAQDLAQETMARLCAHWARVHGMDAPSAWLHRVALNLARSSFRARRVARAKAHMLASPAADDDDLASAIALRAAVAALPERQRRALVLRYYADLPVSDVTRLMRCPPGKAPNTTTSTTA